MILEFLFFINIVCYSSCFFFRFFILDLDLILPFSFHCCSFSFVLWLIFWFSIFLLFVFSYCMTNNFFILLLLFRFDLDLGFWFVIVPIAVLSSYLRFFFFIFPNPNFSSVFPLSSSSCLLILSTISHPTISILESLISPLIRALFFTSILPTPPPNPSSLKNSTGKTSSPGNLL